MPTEMESKSDCGCSYHRFGLCIGVCDLPLRKCTSTDCNIDFHDVCRNKHEEMLYRTKFPDLPWPPPPNPEKNNVVENPFESDKYVCAECHPYRPSTLAPSIPPNNDKKNTVELLSSDEEDESNDTSPPVQSLPKDWIKCTTTQVQRKKDPNLPLYYFFNTTTGHTSWVPPMPGGSNASKSTKPIGINKDMLVGTQKNAPSVKGYFHSVRLFQGSIRKSTTHT